MMMTIAKQTLKSNDEVIEQKVKDFMQQSKMFTSVDICNAVKDDGTWIRNREIATWLRDRFKAFNLQNQYAVTQITVGNNLRANLYHPAMMNVFDYKDTNQKALTPDDFKAKHKFDAPVSKSSTLSNNAIKTFVCVRNDRIRIPVDIVKQMSLNPGDSVNQSMFSIPVSNKLKVTKDGRINLINENLPTKVKIFVWNKIIHIDRA